MDTKLCVVTWKQRALVKRRAVEEASQCSCQGKGQLCPGMLCGQSGWWKRTVMFQGVKASVFQELKASRAAEVPCRMGRAGGSEFAEIHLQDWELDLMQTHSVCTEQALWLLHLFWKRM